MPCSLPRWTGQVLVGFFPAARPSPNNGRVGIHNFTFEACSSFTRVTACKVAARPKADPCPEASIRPVTQPNRSVASMSYRQLHRWNLPPLMTCALGAHRYLSRYSVVIWRYFSLFRRFFVLFVITTSEVLTSDNNDAVYQKRPSYCYRYCG
jgi:hypothetical protein